MNGSDFKFQMISNSKHPNVTRNLNLTVQILRRLVTDQTCSKLDAYWADNWTYFCRSVWSETTFSSCDPVNLFRQRSRHMLVCLQHSCIPMILCFLDSFNYEIPRWTSVFWMKSLKYESNMTLFKSLTLYHKVQVSWWVHEKRQEWYKYTLTLISFKQSYIASFILCHFAQLKFAETLFVPVRGNWEAVVVVDCDLLTRRYRPRSQKSHHEAKSEVVW